MNTAPTRRALASGATALTLASLTACGAIGDLMPGSDPFLDQSPRSIAKASFADMQDVTSMRILGKVDDKKHGRMSLDLSVGQDGCQGSIQIDGQGGFQLRQNGDGTWIRPDQKFWETQADTREQGEQAWKVVRNRWIVLEEEDEGEDEFLDLCDLDGFLAEFELEPEDTEESLDSEDVVKVGDSDAVPITGGKGKNRSTIWVSLDDPHYVLKTAPVKDKGLPDALYFEEFGLKVVVEAPSEKEIFELPKGQSPV